MHAGLLRLIQPRTVSTEKGISHAGYDGTSDKKHPWIRHTPRHKTLLAYATALGVDILLLDEPANGLDITSKKALRKILARTTSTEQTVIISTHTVSDLRELYDGVIVLSKGELLLAKPSWEICERISCVSTTIPSYNPLFMEQGPGVFYSIITNETGEPAELNYGLLYSSLLSPSRDKILKAISGNEKGENL